MSRHLSWVAVFATALLLVGAAPVAAVGPFAPAEVVIGGCTFGVGDAAVAVDGTTRGLANCTGDRSGRIWFFRDRPGTAPDREPSPYTGVVLAVAWDGLDSIYVVFRTGSQLMIGKRVESTGTYSPLTTLTVGPALYLVTADVVASAGRWWTVWSERVAADTEFARNQLFQRHTLLGVQGRTRITTTAAGVDDQQPTLAYTSGRMTMVWSRQTHLPLGGGIPADLRIAESSGGGWLSQPFASLGQENRDPDLAVYGGVTWVTWTRDGRIVVANNSGGAFHSRTFATVGADPTVAVSGTNAFVAWWASDANRVVIAELSSGAWAGGQVAGARSYPLRVLAQGAKARVVYWAADIATESAALNIRTQI